ncbi:MAG: hypothetical protein LUG95_08100 [Clostridiales bacterium]|nr:hypothetical protein [Clostridiales bacterium]
MLRIASKNLISFSRERGFIILSFVYYTGKAIKRPNTEMAGYINLYVLISVSPPVSCAKNGISKFVSDGAREYIICEIDITSVRSSESGDITCNSVENASE